MYFLVNATHLPLAVATSNFADTVNPLCKDDVCATVSLTLK